MRLGVLDIGSNSAQLQIVDVRPGAPPLPAHAVKEPTLLGEEIGQDGSISDDGIERVVRAVADAVTAAVRHGVDQLYPFATSAVRDATTGRTSSTASSGSSASGRSSSTAGRRPG